MVCVVYMDDCLFWKCSKYYIDNVMNYFKDDGPSNNWEKSKGNSVSEFLDIDINTLD